MLTRLLHYVHQHTIAILALICSLLALAGSSYAAITISGGQLRNHSVDAVKLNPRSIAASIKAWVNVQETSRGLVVAGSSSPVRLEPFTGGEDIFWRRQRFSARCGALVTPQYGLAVGPTGYVTSVPGLEGRSPRLGIIGHAASGPDRPQPVFVAIVCP